MPYDPDKPATKCSICKLPIKAEHHPSVLLQDGQRQIHIDCFARIEKLRIERLRSSATA
jgi:hypothetical protein